MTLYVIIAVAIVVAAIVVYRKKAVKKVPQGLQVFDENGNVVVDTSERITKYLGSFTVPTDADSGTITNSEIGDGDLWYTIRVDNMDVSTAGDGVIFQYPIITKGDGMLTWSYPHSTGSIYRRYGVTVYYGVY